jgi:uncharacterized protein (TIGR00255 family)
MISMTGHGRGQISKRGCQIVVECASVNRRQLDCVVQLPREWSSLEHRIREEASASITRGRLQIQVSTAHAAQKSDALVNPALAVQAARELRGVAKELGLSDPVTLDQILRIPGVVRSAGDSSSSLSPEEAWPLVRDALRAALKELGQMRADEGRNLQRALKRHGAILRKLLAKINKRAPQVSTNHRNHLEQRLRNSGLPLDPPLDDRLLGELALFAERCDITEELTRIESHLDQYDLLLASTAPVGRTLEFLTQEIFRELNTAGSKSNDARISQLVVDCKSELDKIREQILNIE